MSTDTCDYWSCSLPGERVKLPDSTVGHYCPAHTIRVLENFELASKHPGPGPWMREETEHHGDDVNP